MKRTSVQFVRKLQKKNLPAAWIVSNFIMMQKHVSYVNDLIKELRKYNHVLNVFGHCGKNCRNGDLQQFKTNEYYFYSAFEDSIADDYVTDQLLIALNKFGVPVVYRWS